MIRNCLLLHRPLKVEMIADYSDNAAREFADGPAMQEIDKAMAEGGNEHGHRRMFVGKAQLPFHGVGLGERPERRGNLTGRDSEVIELPFDSGKEVVSLEIDVMV